MKRVFAFFTVAAVVLALAGCTGRIDPYSVTLADADDDYTESTVALPAEITFDRLTVCEGDDYNIIIRGIKPDAPEGYVLSLDIANNSEIKETTKTVYVYATDEDGEKTVVGEEEVAVSTGQVYRFAVESAVVNGKQIDVSYSVKLSADDRTFDQILLDKAALDGLGAITEIRLQFQVYAVEEEERLVSNLSAVIYPYGEEALGE